VNAIALRQIAAAQAPLELCWGKERIFSSSGYHFSNSVPVFTGDHATSSIRDFCPVPVGGADDSRISIRSALMRFGPDGLGAAHV
jgi:hypothetical protein